MVRPKLNDLILEAGALRAGFTSEWGYAMTGLWYDSSPNLIDVNDYGREWQVDMIEGAPGEALLGDPWRKDIINPTQGGAGGNWGASPSTLVDVSGNEFTAQVQPLDFTTMRHRGPYRLKYMTNWPMTSWDLYVTYRIDPQGLTLRHLWNHHEERYVRMVRAPIYVDTKHFQPPFYNEEARVWDSHKSARFDDTHVAIAGAGVVLSLSGLGRRLGFAFNHRDRNKLAEPGDADVIVFQVAHDVMDWTKEVEHEARLNVFPQVRRKHFGVGAASVSP